VVIEEGGVLVEQAARAHEATQHSHAATADLAGFASLVSHDFSGPLRAIRGFAGLVVDSPKARLDDEQRRYIGEIITASERMQALNDGLVSCLRVPSATMEFTDVSLDDVVTSCLDELGARVLSQRARVTVAPLPVVHADAAAIRVVVHHLLDNALRYTVPGRTPVIDVVMARGETSWAIMVRDNGTGMDETNRERAFVMFKRLQPAHDRARPGVGLTLCRSIVERHGGQIWISDVPGEAGVEVTFTLPRHPESATGAPAAGDPRQTPLDLSVRPSQPASGGTVTQAGDHREELAGSRRQFAEARANLAAIVDSSDDAILSMDLHGLILSWNRAAEALYGFSADEAIGQHDSILIPPDQTSEVPRMMSAVIAGQRQRLETVRRHRDGSLIGVSLTISPIRDTQGAVVGASIFARDVTERREADDLLRAFLEVTPDAILVIDLAGAIYAVNSQALAIFGYAHDALVGQPLEMLFPEQLRHTIVEQRRVLAAAGKKHPRVAAFELSGLRRDGTDFPVDVQLSWLPTKDGVLPVAAIRDVTERRRLEHLRDDFIANAAHELRTPLTTLAGLGETLARSHEAMAPADMEAAYAAMARQGGRARVLISNLLDLSNVDGGRADFVIVAVEIDRLVGRALEAAPAPDGKTVTVAIEPGIIVQADSARLEQVVINLLVNAYRYGGQQIHVSAVVEDGRVVLAVADDGRGVTPDLATTLFEPFSRGKETNVVRGSGIGLALCRRIVQRMDGQVWHEPVSPHGACFRVSLRPGP
jgi:PAS domain S-box-containing protein